MAKLLKNGFILAESGLMKRMDCLIEDGIITKLASVIEIDEHDVYDIDGKVILPGFVDLHVHLREPGNEEKETIATGTHAAAKGGFTTICAMPNTKPVPDSGEQLRKLKERIEESAIVRVLPYASITMREFGEELTNFSELAQRGAIAFTDDGVGVQDAGIMFEAMKQAAKVNKVIVAHCEEEGLINHGCVHAGSFAEQYNLKGIPSICESVHIARDVLLAEAANVRYHVCHISTKESVRVVREAKRAGIKVTAEVTPHHLILCDEDIPGLDTNYKMNPPLRSREDRQALIDGLLDGTIDVIATDHAPHTQEEKQAPMEYAPFGIVGLETTFPLLYTYLVEKNILSLEKLVELLTRKPCETFDLPYGEIAEGKPADLTIVDLERSKKIDTNKFLSKARNTPFKDWECKGWPTMTLVNGEIVWKEEE